MSDAKPAQIAAEYGERLSRYCDRCELTGDLRRGVLSGPERPLVEFVCVPKMQGEENLLELAICSFVATAPEAVLSRTRRFHFGTHYLIRTLWGTLRVWIATPETFGACWLYTTGPATHLLFLCDRARALRGHLAPFSGLWKGLGNFGRNEDEIYRALELEYTTPRERRGAIETGAETERPEFGAANGVSTPLNQTLATHYDAQNYGPR